MSPTDSDNEDFTDVRNKLGVVDALRPFLSDDEMYGRMLANLHDLLEVGEWLSSKLDKVGAEPFSADEAESFLIELDVHVVQHATWHLRSLQKDIAAVLATLPDEDS